jgi:hypothetical protein
MSNKNLGVQFLREKKRKISLPVGKGILLYSYLSYKILTNTYSHIT